MESRNRVPYPPLNDPDTNNQILDPWLFCYLHGGLHRLLDDLEHEHVQLKLGDSWPGSLGTSCDRMMQGALLVCLEAQYYLQPIAEAYWGGDNGPEGVFVYEYLDYLGDNGIPEGEPSRMTSGALCAYLWRGLSEEQWFDAAENNRVDTVRISQIVAQWAIEQVGQLRSSWGSDHGAAPLCVVDTTPDLPYDYEDLGLDQAGLIEKYAEAQEHPEYTNARWATEAHDQPYWEWVVGKIAADDEAY